MTDRAVRRAATREIAREIARLRRQVTALHLAILAGNAGILVRTVIAIPQGHRWDVVLGWVGILAMTACGFVLSARLRRSIAFLRRFARLLA